MYEKRGTRRCYDLTIFRQPESIRIGQRASSTNHVLNPETTDTVIIPSAYTTFWPSPFRGCSVKLYSVNHAVRHNGSICQLQETTRPQSRQHYLWDSHCCWIPRHQLVRMALRAFCMWSKAAWCVLWRRESQRCQLWLCWGLAVWAEAMLLYHSFCSR